MISNIQAIADANADAHRAGIRPVMITGDHPATALRIATDLGIVVGPGATARTGTELDGLTDEEFAAAVRETSVFARVAPAHKLRIVDALQADRHVVAMTGDGVNDAPALKSADIGIAMGITGTEVTKEAATMILGDDNYATIVRAVRQGRVIFDNITKFLRYLLSSNMGEVATVFLGVVLASAIGLTDGGTGGLVGPLLATQILWINLVTDSGPALAMGMDPEIADVMGRAPRSPDDRILDREMWGGILSIGLVMAAVTLLTIDIALPAGLVEGQASFVEGRTAGFTALVFAQLFNALNARSATTSAFHGLLSNRWRVGAVVLGAVLQVAVVELPFLHPELYREHGLRPPKGVLLYGPPGCGKTLIARAVATSLARTVGGPEGKAYFLNIKGPELLNKFVGETERQIRVIFARARERARGGVPVIVFFDEMESLFRIRGAGVSSDVETTIVPQLLAEVDGVEALENVIIIGASNREDMIDPAILRPGRLDLKIRIERPDEEGARSILSKYLTTDLPLHEAELAAHGSPADAVAAMIDVAVERLYATTPENRYVEVTLASGEKEVLHVRDFASGALIANVVDRAKKAAIKDLLATGERGLRTRHVLDGLAQELRENEDLRASTDPDQWARISGRRGERVSLIRMLRDDERAVQERPAVRPVEDLEIGEDVL